MTEFSSGIFKVIASTSAGRALVYTVGHVIIAMTVVSVLTGPTLITVTVAPIVSLMTIALVKPNSSYGLMTYVIPLLSNSVLLLVKLIFEVVSGT